MTHYILLHVVDGLTAKQTYKKAEWAKAGDLWHNQSLQWFSYQLWFGEQGPFPLHPLYLFAASDFSSLARRCLGWPPGETISPWSHSGVSLRQVKEMSVKAILYSSGSHGCYLICMFLIIPHPLDTSQSHKRDWILDSVALMHVQDILSLWQGPIQACILTGIHEVKEVHEQFCIIFQ